MALIDVVRSGTAAGIVLGVRSGDRVDVQVAGLRGPGGAPLTVDTPFPVASITKPATAALLHALHARGDLDLDVRAWHDATWRELLRHTGGAGPDYEGGIERFGNGDGAPAAYAEHPERIAWLGAPWSYANPGYWLAGAHAAAVSGSPFARGLRELVLDPAGATGADSRPWRDDPALLAHDDPDPRRNSYLAMPRVRVPSGGLRATVGDVLALAAATWPGGALGDLGVLGEAPFADAYGGRPAARSPPPPARGPAGWRPARRARPPGTPTPVAPSGRGGTASPRRRRGSARRPQPTRPSTSRSGVPVAVTPVHVRPARA
ncbi:serine hydrolase domain-containing protein [Actinoplanes sp. RD1]|uniref:serine hydrolase domain-containing protein n=1 Tax=Actinoplanes sp. RD1 TaxID=3064538 RepID=UPI0027407303|nr:serine hydrolase domain-containing protein [Actinoplanes sp. RD1]